MIRQRPLQWAIVLTLASPMTVLAQSPGFYVSGAAGITLPRYSQGAGYNNDTGQSVLVSSGFSFKNNLRTELAAGYQNHSAGTAVSLMSNIFYEFHNSSNFRPYVGAGIGGLWVNGNDGALATSVDQSHPIWAYQGIVGIDYTIANTLHYFLDYRYFSMRTESTASTEHTSQDGTHGVMLGLRWSFRGPAQKKI